MDQAAWWDSHAWTGSRSSQWECVKTELHSNYTSEFLVSSYLSDWVGDVHERVRRCGLEIDFDFCEPLSWRMNNDALRSTAQIIAGACVSAFCHCTNQNIQFKSSCQSFLKKKNPWICENILLWNVMSRRPVFSWDFYSWSGHITHER